MKIGMLTFPLNANYGNILQAFALLTHLKRAGYDVELIDKRLNNPSAQFKVKSIIKNLMLSIFGNILFKKYPSYFINKGFDLFVKNEIKPKTRIIYNSVQLEDIIKKNEYDAIVIGSDQIWRKDYLKEEIILYFMPFFPNRIKKIAYSASYGVSHWQFNEDETRKIRALLNDFSGISVREESAVDLCTENLGINVKHVIDPTMLLNKEYYINALQAKNELLGESYLFSYILDDNVNVKLTENYITNKFSLHSSVSFTLTGIRLNDKNISSKNPINLWIQYLYSSKFVVTDSFHGVVFSIIFNKPFIVIPNAKRGLTRFTSLLNMFNIENRIVENLSRLDEAVNDKIDWNTVNSILNDKRKEASKFIISALE